MVIRRLKFRTFLPLALFLILATGALAQTPDGETPAEEVTCDAYSGRAFGLCNAYCEAIDCDMFPGPSCEVLRVVFQSKTGTDLFPCDFRDECGVINGDNSTCAGCDGVPNSGLYVDDCGVCGGNNECEPDEGGELE